MALQITITHPVFGATATYHKVLSFNALDFTAKQAVVRVAHYLDKETRDKKDGGPIWHDLYDVSDFVFPLVEGERSSVAESITQAAVYTSLKTHTDFKEAEDV